MMHPTPVAAVRLGALLLTAGWLALGCAAGGRAAGDGQVTGGDASQTDSMVPQPDGSAQSDAQVGVDAAGCAGGCSTPPGDCHVDVGQCVGTTCVYAYKGFGDSCNDGDGCTANDTCDGQGNCFGDTLNCSPPHTSGGSCSGGTCVGIQCDSGWDNCDSDLLGTGCESPLNTSSDCGSCGAPCNNASHATASCATGSCVQTCVAPYKDCDGNMGNGCEIPEGVVNSCDANGLNSSTGCWTAWCGQSADSWAYNQSGNWYCAKCSNCEEVGSQCHWCSPTQGVWYPLETCGCTNYPVVCGPY